MEKLTLYKKYAKEIIREVHDRLSVDDSIIIQLIEDEQRGIFSFSIMVGGIVSTGFMDVLPT